MATTIQMLISIESDTHNTNSIAKLKIQPTHDGDLVFISISDSDREISVTTKDLSAALKAVQEQTP